MPLYSQQRMTLLDQHVYFYTIAGHMTKENLIAFDHDVCEQLNASHQPRVHVIINMSEIESIPSLTETRNTRFLFHPRLGYSIRIGGMTHPVIRCIITLTVAAAQVSYKDAASLLEACDFLCQVDSSLPPLTEWCLPCVQDEPVEG